MEAFLRIIPFETQPKKYPSLFTHLFIPNVRKWARRKRVRTNLVNFPARSYVIPEPLGVSLVIGAWQQPNTLPPVTLELGGKSQAFVTEDYNPNRAS